MEDSITKKLQVVRKRSSNGEIHLILQEFRLDENRKNEDLDEDEIRKIMKKEASKPLLILREE